MQYRAIADARAKTLGDDSPETLYARTAVANMLGPDASASRGSDGSPRRAQAVAERVLGPGHRTTLVSRRLILESAIAEKKYKEVVDGYRKLLADEEKYLGPEALETLSVRVGLAVVLMMGESADAVPELRKVVDGRTKILGPNHNDTLNSRTNLGIALLKGGKVAEAEKELRGTLQAYERTQGPEHPGTLYCCGMLTVCLAIAREQDEATALAVRASALARKILQADNPDIEYYERLLKAVRAGCAAGHDKLGILRM